MQAQTNEHLKWGVVHNITIDTMACKVKGLNPAHDNTKNLGNKVKIVWKFIYYN